MPKSVGPALGAFAGADGGAIGAGAISGAVAGTTVMPGWGTLIGGALGAVGGLLSSQQQQKAESEAARAAKASQRNPITPQRDYDTAKLIIDWTKHRGTGSKWESRIRAALAARGISADRLTDADLQAARASRARPSEEGFGFWPFTDRRTELAKQIAATEARIAELHRQLAAMPKSQRGGSAGSSIVRERSDLSDQLIVLRAELSALDKRATEPGAIERLAGSAAAGFGSWVPIAGALVIAWLTVPYVAQSTARGLKSVN